jgi:hypothetical protein
MAKGRLPCDDTGTGAEPWGVICMMGMLYTASAAHLAGNSQETWREVILAELGRSACIALLSNGAAVQSSFASLLAELVSISEYEARRTLEKREREWEIRISCRRQYRATDALLREDCCLPRGKLSAAQLGALISHASRGRDASFSTLVHSHELSWKSQRHSRCITKSGNCTTCRHRYGLDPLRNHNAPGSCLRAVRGVR